MIYDFSVSVAVAVTLLFMPKEGHEMTWCSIKLKAKKLLGWEATADLQQMCADSWNFTKNNPDGIK